MTEPAPTTIHVSRNSANAINIDTRIRPIYPVRYGYANFFEDSLAPPAQPPPLSNLLEADSVQSGDGYLARLLRPGWVYVREEDNEERGYLHIFKYEHAEQDGRLEERFSKYIFKNGINAKEGLRLDQSGAHPEGYPFVFVRRKVKRVSIAYSEHEWSAEVIDAINSDRATREASMQQVNLIEDDPACVDATPDNLRRLVEDYRDRQVRLLRIAQEGGPKLEDIDIDILTTQSSHQMDANAIAAEIRRKTPYGETAKIVGLFDPVGRQKEIIGVHNLLTAWAQIFTQDNVYPLTIGQIIEDLNNCPDADIKKLVRKSVDIKEHAKYWGELDDRLGAFKARQQQFVDLYKAFTMDPAVGSGIGSLNVYFTHFFCAEPSSDEAREVELQKLCHVSADIFDGIMASEPGRAAMEDIIASTSSGWDAFLSMLHKVVTQPQENFDWSEKTAKMLDVLLRGLAALLGQLIAWGQFAGKLAYREMNRLTGNGLKFIVEDLIPKLFRVMGVEVSQKTVRYTPKSVLDIIAKQFHFDIDNANIVRGHGLDLEVKPGATNKPSPSDIAEKRLRRLQRLFDWGERMRATKIPFFLELAQVEVRPAARGRFTFVVPKSGVQALGMMFDSTFAGLSAVGNISTIHSVLLQTRFQNLDPLQRGSAWHSVTSLVAAITALTVDVMQLTRLTVGMASAATTRVSASAGALAKALAPKLQKQAGRLATLLAGEAVKRLIAISNVFGALASGYDAYRAWKAGNTGQVAGHAALTIGSGMLAVQALMSLGVAAEAGAAGSASTGVGIGPGALLAIVGLAFIGAGALLLYLYAKSDFQVLLENCFWGKGRRYAFWGSARPAVAARLERARDLRANDRTAAYYRTELQEFFNYLYLPSVEIDDDSDIFGNGKKLKYSFFLPGFQLGESEIKFEVVRRVRGAPKFIERGVAPVQEFEEIPDAQLTELLRQQIDDAKFENKDGATAFHITLEAEAEGEILLDWHYEPRPGMIVPARYLRDGDLHSKVLIGMRNSRPH